MFKVLVIEADSTLRQAMHTVLEMAGYEVHCAHDGPSGIAEALTLCPTVLICDTTLPHQDGIAVLETLRSSMGNNAFAFVLMGAYFSPHHMQRATELQVAGFLLKPFTDAELLRKVETATHSFLD